MDTLTMRKLLHDLKSPLTAIKILRARRPYERPEDNLLKAALGHLEILLTNCVGESATNEKYMTSEDIYEMCSSLIKEKQIVAGHQIEFIWKAEGATIEVPAVNLHKILSNLLQNGIDAAQKRAGSVQLEVIGGLRHLEFRIFDDGPANSFKPATARAPKSADGGKGWGVGLLIVGELVRESRGRLSFSSRPGLPGTVATVSWMQKES